MRSTIVLIGGGIAGCTAALELAETDKYNVVLIEALDSLLSGTSDKTPCRLGLGFHYMDPETALKNLHTTLIFVKKYPGFRVAEHEPDHHPLKRCQYYVVEGSRFAPHEVLAVCERLKSEYRALCKKDLSNRVFGDPENFFRIMHPAEYKERSGADSILLGVETAECILDWFRFKTFLSTKVLNHENIHVRLSATVKRVAPIIDSTAYEQFELECEDRTSLKASMVINCTWHNIESLNRTMNITDPPQRCTQRLKAMAEVVLPPELDLEHSAVFCYGPFAAFTNLGVQKGYVTFEPVTNIESTEATFSERAVALLRNDAANAEIEDEMRRIGISIILGATKYLPTLSSATLKQVHFGVVRTFGSADIYGDKKVRIHSRKESGVAERALGFVENGSMKWIYCVSNALMIKRIVHITENAYKVLHGLIGTLRIPSGDKKLKHTIEYVLRHQLSCDLFQDIKKMDMLLKTLQARLRMVNEFEKKFNPSEEDSPTSMPPLRAKL